MIRAMMSAVPPAPEDTTIWIGRVGQLCAKAELAGPSNNAASTAAPIRFISLSPFL
jgi:hypothetical protein